MHNNTIIIVTLCAGILLSIFALSYTESRQVRNGENFWSVAFIDPLGAANDVMIDNRTHADTVFHYIVRDTDGAILMESDITIPTRTTQTVTIPHTTPLTVTVTAGDDSFTLTKKENSLAQ